MKRQGNHRVTFKVLGFNLIILSAFVFTCVPVALYYSEDIMPFVYTSLFGFSMGLILKFFSLGNDEMVQLRRKESFLIVTLSWIFIILIGSLPYLFSNAIPGVVNAIFESVSGFTTTGSSILTDIEVLPRSIVYWRSLTHWIGGIGIIVLVIIVMPAFHVGSYQLFTLESSLQDRIQPKIKSIGNRVLLIYVILTMAETLFLVAGQMPLFDSVCHSFGTVATGGFSTKNASIIEYSPYIQYVITIFMLLAGINFAIHYYLYKREFNKVRENEELRFYLFVVFLLVAVVTVSLYFTMPKTLEESFRESFFQVVSIVTCTGFASADYLQWPAFAWTIIFFSMFLGGSTGSTAGGIKMARHLILFKNIKNIFYQLISPHAVLPIKLNGKVISAEANKSILTFITVYILVFAAGSLSLALLGMDGQTASSAVATCMAGIGPGIGTIGPVSNFAHLPDLGKVILSVMMLLGRLEIYTVIVLFSINFRNI
ncbi:MAG TPA: TrkH family potassium uptake protein [Prolixibacteraceae bacterium]|nr:TrkH family potassium uptake protein [Prolixibacteraceae bacterium]